MTSDNIFDMEVLRVFYGLPTLRQREIDGLRAAGVGVRGLAYPDEIRRARVRFEADFFDLVDDGEPALVLLLRDEFGEPVDLAAWQPRPDRIATWLRRATLKVSQTSQVSQTLSPFLRTSTPSKSVPPLSNSTAVCRGRTPRSSLPYTLRRCRRTSPRMRTTR